MGRRNDGSEEIMDYLQNAKDYASMWAIDAKGKYEFTFDETGLEYFLDSIGLPMPQKEWKNLSPVNYWKLVQKAKTVHEVVEEVEKILKGQNHD